MDELLGIFRTGSCTTLFVVDIVLVDETRKGYNPKLKRVTFWNLEVLELVEQVGNIRNILLVQLSEEMST